LKVLSSWFHHRTYLTARIYVLGQDTKLHTKKFKFSNLKDNFHTKNLQFEGNIHFMIQSSKHQKFSCLVFQKNEVLIHLCNFPKVNIFDNCNFVSITITRSVVQAIICIICNHFFWKIVRKTSQFWYLRQVYDLAKKLL
jgi:hypothetical protein